MKKKLSLLMVALVAVAAFATTFTAWAFDEKKSTAAEQVSNIAALTALGDKAEFTFTAPLTVQAMQKKGTNVYCYVKDDTGWTLIYDAGGSKTENLAVGKKIAANWDGAVSIYNGLFEAVPAAALTATEDAAVTPTFETVPVTAVTAANVNKIVKLEGVTVAGVNGNDFKVKSGELSVAGYNQFGVEGLASGAVVNMTGAIGIYNTTVQFQPIAVEVVTPAPAPADVEISPASGADIYAALNEATALCAPKSVTINLAANGEYTLSNPITSSANLIINGNGATIDASANTGAIVKMGTPAVVANIKNFYEVETFAIKNVIIKNIKSYVYDDNKNAYAFADFAVEGCVFEFNNTKQDIDAPFRFQAGGPVKFTLKDNTMYQKGSFNNKYFVKIGSGNFPDKAFETFAGPYVWDIENNTFYQTIAHGEGTKMAFINGGRIGNNFTKTSVTILKNLFIDCAGSEAFLKDLFGGKQSDADRANFVKIDTDYNTYWTDAAAINVSKYDKGANTIAADPGFKDAANGDFTLAATSAQNTAKTGDPRWISYSINVADGIENGSVVPDVTSAAAGTVVTLTATPAAGYELDAITVTGVTTEIAVTVTDGKFTMPADDVTVNATFKKLPADVKVEAADITDGDITAAITAKAAGAPIKNLTLNLADGGAYTVSVPIIAGGSIAINGAAGATIDASAVSGPLLQYAVPSVPAAAPRRAPETPVEGYTYIDNVSIKDVAITGVKGSIYWDGNQKVCIESFSIENAVIALATESTSLKDNTLVSFQGGSAKDFTIKNSTIYGNAVAKYFNKASGNDFVKAGYAEATITYENNTFYNLLNADGQWGNNLRYNNNYSKITLAINNNIWVDCGNGQILRRMLNKNFADFKAGSTMSGNVYNAAGAVVDQANYGNGSDINGVITFTDAANGNFNGNVELPFGAEAPATQPGDTEWILTYTNAPQLFTINKAETTNGSFVVKIDDAEVTEAAAEATVAIIATPDAGYEVDAVTVKGVTTDIAVLPSKIVGQDNAYQFSMPADAVTVTVTFKVSTGINGVKADALKDAQIYNLQGVRVDKAQKGLYIVNGKKVVIK